MKPAALVNSRMNSAQLKNFFLTLGVALAASAVTYGVFFVMNRDSAMHRAAREGDAMAWLQAEFQLDAGQFTAIKQLHDDYGVVCAEHCALITKARNEAAAAGEQARLEKLCVDAMTAHFRRVAALMPPAQGERYLATVLLRISSYPHAGAPSVQLSH